MDTVDKANSELTKEGFIIGSGKDSETLVDWKNPPSLKDLKSDYEDSKSAKVIQEGKINAWLDNLNITGSAKIKKRKGRSGIQPKLIRKQAEWRYAALSEPFLSTPDIFNCYPVTHEDKKAAIQNELVLNSQFNNQLDKVNFIDNYVRTGVNEGTIILRTSWKYEEAEVEVTKPVFEYHLSEDPQHALLLEEVAQTQPAQLEKTNPELLKALQLSQERGAIYVPVKVGEQQVKETKVIKNHPYVEICDYRNVTVDPTCKGDLSQAQFIIYSFETSKAELEKDGKYKNLDQLNVKGKGDILNSEDHEIQNANGFNFKDEPRKKIVAYEYWGYYDIDGTGELKAFVATWVDDVCIRMEESPYPDNELPFVMVPYLPVKNSVYGEPDGSLLEDNQAVVGAVTRGMIDVMGRSANGQQGMRKDALDPVNRQRYNNGQDYEFNPNVDPRQMVYMHTYPELPQSVQVILQNQHAEAESMSGVKAFSQGITGQALGENVGGIRSALDATAKREMGILRRLTEGLIKVGRKFIMMNAEFLEDTEVIRITNDTFEQVRRDDLAGKIDLRLAISTAEEDNQQANDLSFMLQTIGNNVDFAFTQMIWADIARLRKMPALEKKIAEFKPEPNPLQQKREELEVAKLEHEIAELQAKTLKLRTAAQLDVSKAGTEEAKQGNLNSDTDLKDLDYIEQEQGVKQERDLQKLEVQGEVNKDLKKLDNNGKTSSNVDDKTVSNGITAE